MNQAPPRFWAVLAVLVYAMASATLPATAAAAAGEIPIAWLCLPTCPDGGPEVSPGPGGGGGGAGGSGVAGLGGGGGALGGGGVTRQPAEARERAGRRIEARVGTMLEDSAQIRQRWQALLPRWHDVERQLTTSRTSTRETLQRNVGAIDMSWRVPTHSTVHAAALQEQMDQTHAALRELRLPWAPLSSGPSAGPDGVAPSLPRAAAIEAAALQRAMDELDLRTPEQSPDYAAIQEAAVYQMWARQAQNITAMEDAQRDMLLDGSELLIVAADGLIADGQTADGRAYLRRATAIIDAAVSVGTAVLLPEVSVGRSALELALGQNLFTGEPLSDLERAMEVANILSLGYTSAARRSVVALGHLVGRGGRIGATAGALLGWLQRGDLAARALTKGAAGGDAAVGSAIDALLRGVGDGARGLRPWRLTNVGPHWHGSKVLRSFTLHVEGRVVNVKVNATKHLWRYATKWSGDGNFPIAPLADVVGESVKQGLSAGRHRRVVGAWELAFEVEGETIELIHANYRPKGWLP